MKFKSCSELTKEF